MKELILEMIKIKCIKFSPNDPFLYTSGLRGPLYCDNRLIPSHPHIRTMVIQAFSDLIDNEGNKISYDQIAGLATAGITHATGLAISRGEPMCYIRSKPKGHGLNKIIEGDVIEGAKLLLIEDLVNQGASIGAVVTQLREQGYKVEQALSIVDYRTKNSINLLENLKVELFSLINFFELADTALSEKIIDKNGYELLLKWHDDPSNF